MNPKDKPWTYEEEQQLIDLRYEGHSYKRIAKIIGGTSTMLRKKHSRLMQEAFTPEWYERIQKYEQGEIT